MYVEVFINWLLWQLTTYIRKVAIFKVRSNFKGKVSAGIVAKIADAGCRDVGTHQSLQWAWSPGGSKRRGAPRRPPQGVALSHSRHSKTQGHRGTGVACHIARRRRVMLPRTTPSDDCPRGGPSFAAPPRVAPSSRTNTGGQGERVSLSICKTAVSVVARHRCTLGSEVNNMKIDPFYSINFPHAFYLRYSDSG